MRLFGNGFEAFAGRHWLEGVMGDVLASACRHSGGDEAAVSSAFFLPVVHRRHPHLLLEERAEG